MKAVDQDHVTVVAVKKSPDRSGVLAHHKSELFAVGLKEATAAGVAESPAG